MTIKKSALLSVLLFIVLSVSWPQSALALPPRPDPPSTSDPNVGAGIELSVSGVASPYYAIVQWQDGLGDWHNVDSWRGEVENDRVIWYVSPDLFGKGPFCWVVYRDQETLGISESFTMPLAANTLVRVTVAVTPE